MTGEVLLHEIREHFANFRFKGLVERGVVVYYFPLPSLAAYCAITLAAAFPCVLVFWGFVKRVAVPAILQSFLV